jgi:hypothetical protein
MSQLDVLMQFEHGPEKREQFTVSKPVVLANLCQCLKPLDAITLLL